MIAMIKNHMEAIEQLCRRYNVRRLEVFGSATDDKSFDPKHSDLDFLVEFHHLQSGQHADAYFGLLEEIEDVLGRVVDLVMIRAIKNPYFLESINQNREVVYAA